MTTIRTYSKRTPRAAVSLPVLNTESHWDELDSIMGEGDSVNHRTKGKRKEEFAGKENTANLNQTSNDDYRHAKKPATPKKTSKTTPTKQPLALHKSIPVPTTPSNTKASTQRTPTKSPRPTTPSKSPKLTSRSTTPSKSPRPTTPSKSTTPSKPTTPSQSTKSPRSVTPSKSTTPTKSTTTPSKSPKSTSPSKSLKFTTPSKSPKRENSTDSIILSQNSPPTYDEDSRALMDELDYLLDGLDSSQRDVRRKSMYKLGTQLRKGINKGPVGQHKKGTCLEEVVIQRLVDVLLLRWDQNFLKDKASYLLTAIILHALARDPPNIPHLSRCQTILRDIAFSALPSARGDEIEKQTTNFIMDCCSFAAQDDYTSVGKRTEFQAASSMAIRALAALSFTRSISDSLREEGIVEAIVQLVVNWVDKLPTPPVPSSPFALSGQSSVHNAQVIEVHALLDIKYALIILENATFVNPTTQHTILKDNCNIISAMIKLIMISRDIILLSKNETETLSGVTLSHAAVDSMIGCLKLLLNLTYDHHDACDAVRLSCVGAPASKTAGTNKTGKRRKVSNEVGDGNSNENTNSIGGLAVLLSLLNMQFEEDMFDIHQHVLGLLINLVEENALNRQQVGSIDGAIAKIVSLFMEQKKSEEKKTPDMGIVGAAYSAMLIGWLAYDSPDNTLLVRSSLPAECPFSSIAALLKLFMAYQQQAGILPEDVQKSLVTVIKLFEGL